jgi:hypothetical protein
MGSGFIPKYQIADRADRADHPVAPQDGLSDAAHRVPAVIKSERYHWITPRPVAHVGPDADSANTTAHHLFAVFRLHGS